MPRRPVPNRSAALATGAIVLIAALHFAAFRPGIMTWDAIRQYGQALSGRYDDWHPPAMNWLWRQLGAFGGGPAPMLAVQVALYWGGTALWLRAADTRAQRIALAALVLSPIALVLVGTVLKDSLFAGALLLASGLLATWPGARAVRIVAMSVLIAAATLRFNAVPACLPLLMLCAPAAWRSTRSRLVVTALAAAIPLALALPAADAVLRAERSGVALSLVIYDLGGIGRFAGTNVFPPVPAPAAVADPVAVNAGCYSPVSWDRYAWWGAEPCPVGFETLRAPLAAGPGPYGWWAAAVLRHPLAYAEHRLAYFDRNARFLVRDADLPALSTASDPNPWGFTVGHDPVLGPVLDTVTQAAAIAIATPLGWPVVWLALALGVLLLRPGPYAAAMAWSALLYGFSYLPLGVASEVRYHFWTMTAAGIAAAMTLARRATWASSRRRLVAAALPVTLVTAGCLLARLA